MPHVDIVKKLQSPFFEQKWDGEKEAEIRKEDDVQYKPGMTVKYVHLRPDGSIGDRFIVSKIQHVLRDYPGIAQGYCFYTEKQIERGRLC